MTEVSGVELHVIAWWLGGIFTALAVILSVAQIWLHLLHYHEPEKQRLIIRILLMVPVYAIDSWLSLRFTDYAIYFETIRNAYESYTLYSFLCLLQVYLGDEDEIVEVLRRRRPQPHLFPLCRLRPIPLGRRFLHTARRGTFQYVITKPITTLLGCVLEAFGMWGDGNIDFRKGYVYVTFVDMASVTVAMYYLVLFYVVTKPYIEQHRPVPKFVCVKSVVFLSFWQGVLVALLRRSDVIHASTDFTAENVQSGLQDFLVCVEMFLAALAHIWAFSHKEYRDPTKAKEPFRRRVRDMFRIHDAIADTKNLWKPLPKRDSRDSDEKGSPLLTFSSNLHGHVEEIESGGGHAPRPRGPSDLELGEPGSSSSAAVGATDNFTSPTSGTKGNKKNDKNGSSSNGGTGTGSNGGTGTGSNSTTARGSRASSIDPFD